MSNALPLFTLESKNLQYKQQVILRNINVTIHEGERVALVGKSGSGKSTLLRALREQRHLDAAWCPQSNDLVENLSLFHNIYMGALERHHGLYNLVNLISPRKNPLLQVQQLCELLHLDCPLTQPAKALSGGQQQRAAIARALYQQKSIFLGDEPVSALDAQQGEQLLNLIDSRHATIILCLHDIAQAMRACERIIGLKHGQILFDKSVDKVTDADFTQLYRQG